MPGPPKTPTAILEARGSWLAKTRTNEPEATGEPEKPAHLTGLASEAWDRLLPLLMGLGVAGAVDADALARYCSIYARWRACEAFIAKHGMVLPALDADGKLCDMKEFPQVGRASRLADQLLRLEQQFGMTPSARATLGTPLTTKVPDTDGKQRFFQPRLTTG